MIPGHGVFWEIDRGERWWDNTRVGEELSMDSSKEIGFESQ